METARVRESRLPSGVNQLVRQLLNRVQNRPSSQESREYPKCPYGN
jgi:hypothetical protein